MKFLETNMASASPDNPAERGVSPPLLLDINTIILEEPDYTAIRQERFDRNRAAMKAVSTHLMKEVLPKVESLSREDIAARCIQAYYRGHLGRKTYLELLWKQYEKEEAMRLEKTQSQVEEGELLLQNHRLEVELDDNSTTRRNKSRQYTAHVITIQRTWRAFKRRQSSSTLTTNNNMSPVGSESEELSESDSGSGAQAMSVSTPDDSDRHANTEDDSQSDEDSATNSEQDLDTGEEPKMIEPEPDSIVSDYSEMADPIKEHLANVQIIQKEDLETGNTMFANQFTVGQKIIRSPDETEEQFTKRLRKINYLSLAQEFAALKKVDADALPFDLHKEKYSRDHSPMSEVSSANNSNLATPCEENNKDFTSVPTKVGNGVVKATPEDLEVEQITESFQKSGLGPPHQAWQQVPPGDNLGKQDLSSDLDQSTSRYEPHHTKNNVPGPNSEASTKVGGGMESSRPDDKEKDKKSSTLSPGSDRLEDFDVYNMETTLPQMDWASLEQQLAMAAEEQRRKMSRQTEREEIRRRLAMGVDEDYYGGERAFRKPNLQTRLQGGMNLQLCFMNPTTADDNSDTANPTTHPNASTSPCTEPKQLQPPPRAPPEPSPPPPPKEDEDFFSKQARLQAEAKMALAQVRPMAHMQLEVEKQMRKKSPIAEIVGIPGFGGKQKMSRHSLLEMNLAQLQVVVNDLHTQIEALNEELVLMLVQRDDLHMEQDSMLVDIEDLTRRAEELTKRANAPKAKKVAKKK